MRIVDVLSRIMDGLGILLLITPILGGAYLIFLGAKGARLASSTLKWPATTGTITHSHIDSRINGAKLAYRLKLEYRFSTERGEYTGTELHPSYSWSTVTEAERLREALPHGAEIQVRYDPQNPNRSTILPGHSMQSFTLMITGIILVVFGAGVSTDFVLSRWFWPDFGKLLQQVH